MWVAIRDFIRDLDPELKARFLTLFLQIIGLGRGRTGFNSTADEYAAKEDCRKMGLDVDEVERQIVSSSTGPVG